MVLKINLIEMFDTGHIGQRDAVALFVRVGIDNAKRYDASI